jgi:hypothetical protein
MFQHKASRFGRSHSGTEQDVGGMSGMLQSGSESIGQTVSEYPFSTILGCFALGAVVGVTIGMVLSESPKPHWYERIPEPLGRHWVESFLQSLPESWRSKVG